MKELLKLSEELKKVEKYFTPRIVGEVNDQFIKLAKIKGEDIPWHNHENEDELFHILEGELLMEIENEDAFTMQKGDLFVVKKGVNHRVSAKAECHIMLIESKSTEHTGKVKSAVTKSLNDQKY